MTEKYPFELSPRTRLVVISNSLQSTIDHLATVIAPKADIPVEVLDNLMVAYTYAKQARESVRLARLTFTELVHNQIMDIEKELDDVDHE